MFSVRGAVRVDNRNRVPAAATGLLLLVRARGLGWAELGLGREHWKSGARYALAAVALVLTLIAVGALLPWTRPMFLNDRYATLSGALVASMVIIPLQTVIPEELAFRGVLHGALDRAWGFRGVAAAGPGLSTVLVVLGWAFMDCMSSSVYPAVRRPDKM